MPPKAIRYYTAESLQCTGCLSLPSWLGPLTSRSTQAQRNQSCNFASQRQTGISPEIGSVARSHSLVKPPSRSSFGDAAAVFGGGDFPQQLDASPCCKRDAARGLQPLGRPRLACQALISVANSSLGDTPSATVRALRRPTRPPFLWPDPKAEGLAGVTQLL